MKYPFFLLLTGLFLLGNMAIAQNNEPWTTSQLMAPAFLAEKITSNQTNGMLVLCVGPGALIKGSVNIGAAHEAGNIQKLKDPQPLENTGGFASGSGRLRKAGAQG